jgi:inosine-uridine nucleoside N-ribohydrolase
VGRPIHAGAARPLIAEPVDAREVHGESGMDGTTLPVPTRTAEPDGIEFLIEATRQEEGLHLVATGPLTNVALALRVDPGFGRRLAGITFMGGGALGGNVTTAAEFNVFADPEAAVITLTADCRVRMCGLDLTHQVTGDATYLERLRAIDGPAATLAAEILATELKGYGRYASSAAEPPLHDPVALLAVTHPHLFAEERRTIHVELAGSHSRGTTHVERRVAAGSTGASDPTTSWVHTVDGPAALDLIAEACARWR